MGEKKDRKYLIPVIWFSLGVIIVYILYRVINLFK